MKPIEDTYDLCVKSILQKTAEIHINNTSEELDLNSFKQFLSVAISDKFHDEIVSLILEFSKPPFQNVNVFVEKLNQLSQDIYEITIATRSRTNSAKYN